MRILFEHSERLPVVRYGGAERVLLWLMKALAKKGHEVFLIGSPASDVERYGIHLIPRTEEDWRFHIPNGIDIAHFFHTPKIDLDIPFMVTIQGNGQVGETFHSNTAFISKKHMENHGGSVFVYNAIDFDEYPKPKKRSPTWESFLFLAKASWKVKNLKDCVRACKEKEKSLLVAGGRAWSFSSWIHSYGMVDQNQKLDLLGRTDALLFPVRWHEPFGVAVIEAMAMGLPVIASKYGSLPELVTEETGEICRDFSEFKNAVANKPREFQSDTIREYAYQNFNSDKMASEYEVLYRKIIEGQSLNSNPLKSVFQEDPQNLLGF